MPNQNNNTPNDANKPRQGQTPNDANKQRQTTPGQSDSNRTGAGKTDRE